MAKIKVTSKCELFDGMSITFKAPCDCTAVDGLKVYYNGSSQTFTFRDAHLNNLAGQSGVFAKNAYIKVVLDTRNGYAYLQNADTNAYLKGTYYTKDESLTAATAAMFDLTPNATPNMVFQKLAMPLNTYGFLLTVKLNNGTPFRNVPVQGLTALDGNPAVTDENGQCYAYATTSSLSITINGYLGVNHTQTITATDGIVFTPINITVTVDQSLKLFQTSSSFVVAPGMTLDLCAVGGGGGGGYGGYTSTGIAGTGGGGGGGYVKNTTIAAKNDFTTYSFTVGSGGSAGSRSSAFKYASDEGGGTAGSGGTTTITSNGATILTASGGKGGGNSSWSAARDNLVVSGGAGNGAGGNNGSAGTDGTVRVFGDSSLPLPGGGGGGGGNNAGGKGFGGNGGWATKYMHSSGTNYYKSTKAKNGSGPGGGGGGMNGNSEATDTSSIGYPSYGGSGAAGGVYARVRF